MKKIYKMENLHCANCAAKMENKIKKVKEVIGCEINFMTSQIMLEADDAAFSEIAKKANKICSSVEAGCKIAF